METRIEIEPAASAEMFTLQDELGCSFALAQVLVRRGLGDPVAAKQFLSAADRYLPEQFEGIANAVSLIREHVDRGERITVHGDYDVDGVVATAIMVGALRELDADVDWFIPGRREDGYGLSAETVERLGERGTKLLITVDCGITSVDEVALARERGMLVIVTDHHSPAADGRVPDAPIVHPVLSNYPFTELCGAAVAHKLIGALCGEPRADKDLDLVALATVADCVSLHGENRRLVRDGIKAIANTSRPGLRALMSVADVDPSRLDATSISFRLAPRINAAGRVHRADAGVELFLTDEPQRGREISEQLDQRNGERRHIEQRIRFEAEAQVSEQGERMAYVLAGDDWHPGVIGIVASRIAERHNRPVVMIAFDGNRGTASGRSIAGYDLLAGLNASAEHLLRHGGHKAAAGATIERSELDAFRAAFEAHASATLTEEDLATVHRADAVVSGNELGTDLAEELGQLAPFGVGNPQVSLLVPSARLTDRKTMGEGKHLRFSVESGGVRARAVAFGTTSLPEGELFDATFELELNEFRGAIEPRLLLRAAVPVKTGPIEIVGDPPPGSDRWLAAIHQGSAVVVPSDVEQMQRIGEGAPIDRRGHGVAGTIAALVHTGEPVLVVTADTAIRARHLAGRLDGFALTSWGAIRDNPALIEDFDHLVALDPPTYPDIIAALCGPRVHLGWGPEELRFVHGLLADQHAPRTALTALYRSLRKDGLAAVRQPAWQVRELLAVLVELDLAKPDGSLTEPAVKRDLGESSTFRALDTRNAEALQWLNHAMPLAA